MIQAKLDKIKRSKMHSELLMDKMKSKWKRNRNNREHRVRTLDEEAKAELKRIQAQSDAWMQQVYDMDVVDEVS